MKIGLVSPYVYPLPGGVTQHVRYLYENLRLRGHDVRILTSSHGLQRASEGDVIRLGKGFSMPANGSVGTVTVSPRYVSQVRDVLERERFDVLHFHEPFVPFLSLVLLRESQSVNVGTFHAYGGWSPAYEFGSRAMEQLRRAPPRPDRGLARPRATSSTATSRATTRCIPNGVDLDRFRRAVPLVALAGRDAEHPVRRAVRAPQGRARPAQGATGSCAATAASAGCCSSAAGRRSARRGATSPPAGCGGVEFLGRVSDDEKATSCSGPPTCTSRRRPAASRSGSCCSRRWPPGAPIVASRHPRLQGRRPARPRGAARAAARPRRRSPRRSRGCSATASSRPRWRPAACAAPRSSAGRGSPPRSTTTTASSIRRLAAAGPLPAHFTAPIPPSPRAAPHADGPSRQAVAEPVVAALGAPGLRRPCRRPRRPCRRAPRPRRSRSARSARSSATTPQATTRNTSRIRELGRRRTSRRAALDRVHAELERVQVGRQQPLVRVDERRGQRQRRDVGVQDHEPDAAAAATSPSDEPAGVARGQDLERDQQQRDRRRAAR